jgi:molybdopterin synthase catalytic subunit
VADLIRLTQEPIDIGELYRAVTDPSCGAIACFVGTSRDVHHGRPVDRLSYEAYGPMAEKGLHKLAAELREAYPSLVHLALVHRLGDVPLAEASVVVAASTPHRAEAFAACRAGIDRLKAEIPIWKKEFYKDGGDPVWVANCESAVPSEPTTEVSS